MRGSSLATQITPNGRGAWIFETDAWDKQADWGSDGTEAEAEFLPYSPMLPQCEGKVQRWVGKKG